MPSLTWFIFIMIRLSENCTGWGGGLCIDAHAPPLPLPVLAHPGSWPCSQRVELSPGWSDIPDSPSPFAASSFPGGLSLFSRRAAYVADSRRCPGWTHAPCLQNEHAGGTLRPFELETMFTYFFSLLWRISLLRNLRLSLFSLQTLKKLLTSKENKIVWPDLLPE